MKTGTLITIMAVAMAYPVLLQRNVPAASPATVTVGGVSAGVTPFISEISLTINQASALKSIKFEVTPKAGSVTRSVSATYYTDYLLSRGYLDSSTGQIVLPVFGLYQNFVNSVALTTSFVDGATQHDIVNVTTAQFADPCGYTNSIILQARTNSTALSYDYILLKDNCSGYSSIVLDTNGEIRWAGTAGVAGSFASIFFNNGIYISSDPSGSSEPTGITRMEWDGTFSFVRDYSSLGVTSTGHHNFDPGKVGMLIELNTTTQTESVLMEVDGAGNVLKTWDLAAIISAAMTSGGDDPTQFVQTAPTDWFHNNAATYRKSDDSLIVSSRENFVICLDYQTGAIKWILGDATKKWYQFPSLRQYALALGPATLPPIGQHAVSITQDDNLLLFDDGRSSLTQTPAGADRTYSAPRKYHIDLQTRVATEIWNYEAGQTNYSAFCSSVYEDGPLNYLIDYAINAQPAGVFAELIGLDASGNKVFDYRYVANGCNTAWNAIPIHLEGLIFGTAPAPTPTPSPTSTPKTTTPKMSLEVSTTRVSEGGDVTYIISTSTINPTQATTISYSMSGKAQLGVDYTLSGISGQAQIPPGASATTVVLHALTDSAKEKKETATMTLNSASNKKSKAIKATVTIFDGP